MQAREANRRLVAHALAEAGVPHFAVPGTDDRSTVVAVPQDARHAAERALLAGLAATPGYVSAVPRAAGARERLELCTGDALPPGLADADTIRFTRLTMDATGSLISGSEFGCIVEFWARDGDELVAPRPNKVAARVPADSPAVMVPQYRFTRLYSPFRAVPEGVEEKVSSLAVFDCLKADDIAFPVDAVYTWVDGSDPAWARRKADVKGEVYHEESASDARFLSRDELRYSLRSLHAYAPWIRTVYIVTDDQRPAWLDPGCADVRVVDHRDIFARPEDLPTYNSHAIESRLHRIDGLSEQFLYLNDDMFLGRPIAPQAFFTASGMTKYFTSASRIALGPITPDDTPVDAACKNNRRLLEGTFGRVISQPMDHIAYALSRTVMAEVEAAYPEEYARTSASRFRAMTDLSVTSSLAHYYAMLTGRALPGSVTYGYVQLAHPELAVRLARMLAQRDRDAICINDAFSRPEDMAAQNAVVSPFLDAYFPVPAPAEGPPDPSLPDDTERPSTTSTGV